MGSLCGSSHLIFNIYIQQKAFYLHKWMRISYHSSSSISTLSFLKFIKKIFVPWTEDLGRNVAPQKTVTETILPLLHGLLNGSVLIPSTMRPSILSQ